MSAESPITFTRGVPADESYPTEELVAAATAVLRTHAADVLRYGPAPGFAPLREWIADWQGVAPAQVLTANGSLQIIEFLCLQLVHPGDVVFTEAPTYDRTITLLRRHGARVVGIPLLGDGPDVAALEAALKRQIPRFFYVIPDFQNPAGTTCSVEKRRRIVELAERHGFLVVEDAPYRLLRYRGADVPTMFSLGGGRVVHMGSFTKLIAPGVRAGYLLGDADLVAKLGKLAEDTYISPGYLAHAVTYEWCRRGHLPAQVERLKALYAPRLAACLAALDRAMPDADVISRPEGGFFISLWLPPGVTTTALRTSAAKRGLNLADGLAFFPEGGGERFLRLPYCALTPAQIDDGVARLAETVRDVRAAAAH